MRILAIDNSVVSYVAWHKMHSANYVAMTGSELTEFTRNYAYNMNYYKTLYTPDRTIILMDSHEKIWRDDILNNYYIEHAEMWEYVGDYVWQQDLLAHEKQDHAHFRLLKFDGALFPMMYLPGENKWVKGKKYTIADLKVLDWSLFEPIELDEHGLYFTPNYKGNRTSSWAYKTPKESYKHHAEALAEKFAPVMGAYCIGHPFMEADEMAFLVRECYPDDEIIYITSDSDWHQLGINFDSKFYNPQQHKFFNKKRDCYLHDFWSKILGGDKSDNIPGMFVKDRPAKIGEATAKKMVDEIGVHNMSKWIKANHDGAACDRNMILVSLYRGCKFLENMGVDIEGIKREILNTEPKDATHSYETFGVTKVLLHRSKTQAQTDRAEYYNDERTA